MPTPNLLMPLSVNGLDSLRQSAVCGNWEQDAMRGRALISEHRYIAGAVCALLAATITTATPAQAQGGEAENSYLEALKTCQAETNPEARLACYDRAAGAILAAEDSGDLRVIDREDVRRTRRSLFGFSLPDLGIFGRGDDEDDGEEEAFKVLNTTIERVGGSYETGYVITTAEGAVWQLDEAPRLSPKLGQAVEIRNAALSSYYVRVNGQSGVKARRIR